MTCIVGMVKDNEVYIGGDSAGVQGGNVRIRQDSKVFKNGPMIFGCTSSFRMINLLKYKLRIPEQDKTYSSDYEYLCTAFIDEVIKCFKNNGYAKVDNNQVEGGTFLLGYKGKLYSVDSDYQVTMCQDDYNACGCGIYYALGAMKTLERWDGFNDAPPESYIQEALIAAEYFHGSVRSPFVILKGE